MLERFFAKFSNKNYKDLVTRVGKTKLPSFPGDLLLKLVACLILAGHANATLTQLLARNASGLEIT